VKKHIGVAFLLFLLIALEFAASRKTPAEQLRPDLTDFQDKALDIFLELNKLMTTLATALIGGVAALIARSPTAALIARSSTSRPEPIALAYISVTAAVLSLVLGHFSREAALAMLAENRFNLFAGGVLWLRAAQFWVFLYSTVYLLLFGYRVLSQPTART
jgi:hypothetical protein